jgi:hypothetical protein
MSNPSKPASRQEVYEAIDGERDYQDGLNSRVQSIGDELTILTHYLHLAQKQYCEEFTDPEVLTLGMIRKLAGICVRCLEHHGAPRRK